MNKRSVRSVWAVLIGIALCLSIVSCGGGEGEEGNSGGGAPPIDNTPPTNNTPPPAIGSQTAPSRPSNVSAVGGDGHVTITWRTVAEATSYNLYWGTTSGITKLNGAKITDITTPYVHTDRTNGVTYFYIVTAVNANGESTESVQVSATPRGADPVITFNLAVGKGGTGSGAITSNPPGINCDTLCSASFPSGTAVTLTATPIEGSVLTAWSENCAIGPNNTCTVTANAEKTVTATFSRVTSVSGAITTNTTWSALQSPFLVRGSVLVNTGVTLTIEPGVEVRFTASQALRIDGALIARGNTDRKIKFTSNNILPKKGDWGFIRFTDASTDAVFDPSGAYISGSVLEQCIIEYAGKTGTTTNSAVQIEGSTPFVSNCIVQKNAGDGIFFGKGNQKITGNTIRENDKSGIEISDGEGTPSISNNVISNNKESGIRVDCCFNTALNASISGNEVKNNSFTGIYVQAFNSTPRITISNNLITRNYGGIRVSGPCSSATITGNTITENNTDGGIHAEGGCGQLFTISDNLIQLNRAPDGAGIFFSFVSCDLARCRDVITRNTIVDNVSTAPSGAGGAVSLGPFFTNNAAGLQFTQNNLLRNTNSQETDFALLNRGETSLDVTNNWWGTTDSTAIGTQIYDFLDDANKGVVTFTPFLTAPVESAPPIP